MFVCAQVQEGLNTNPHVLVEYCIKWWCGISFGHHHYIIGLNYITRNLTTDFCSPSPSSMLVKPSQIKSNNKRVNNWYMWSIHRAGYWFERGIPLQSGRCSFLFKQASLSMLVAWNTAAWLQDNILKFYKVSETCCVQFYRIGVGIIPSSCQGIVMCMDEQARF